MKPENRITELDALISLLDEPDADIFNKVKEKIFSYGINAVPVLENAWDHSVDETLQKRIEGIIHHIQVSDIYQELNKWKEFNSSDLLKGFVLIAKYQYPDIDEAAIIKKIGLIIQDVWLELNNNLTPLEQVKVLNHFFDIHGFSGNKANIHLPQNSYINNIFETKKANPISLSIIYLVVAQSLKIPVYGVNLPQNFIIAYLDGLIPDGMKVGRNNIQFYINAFNNGAVFTRREIELFLRQINLEDDDKYFIPCNNVTIIKRVINNLIYSYENSGDHEKTEEFKRLLKALD
jgi:hypothetical protein